MNAPNANTDAVNAIKRFLASTDGKIIMPYLWNMAQKNALYKNTITADAALYKVAVFEMLLEIERIGRA